MRDRVLARAGDLFYAEGITATGVDRVSAVAGVSKRTLYKHFGSKEALVAACLLARDAPIRAAFTASAEERTSDPLDRLKALFEVLMVWRGRDDFRGCPFINAAAELPDPELPARDVARHHKQELRHWIRQQADAGGIVDPDTLSWQLMTLFDGAIAQRLVLGAEAPAEPVLAAATALVAAARASDDTD